MGIHVVSELKVHIDLSAWGGESEISVRCVPEESTNDLGVPVLLQTRQGEEFAARLKEALASAISLVPQDEVEEEMFKEGPLGTWRRS